MGAADLWFLGGVIATFVAFSGVLAWVAADWRRYRRQ